MLLRLRSSFSLLYKPFSQLGTEMSRSDSRCFINKLADYDGQSNVQVDQTALTSLIENYVGQILKHTESPHHERSDLYVGDAGIAFMFLRLSECSHLTSSKYNWLQNAKSYIERAATDKHANSSPGGLLCGAAGMRAVAAVIASRMDETTKVRSHLTQFDKGFVASMNNEWDEILVGRVGFLSACDWINHKIDPPPFGTDPRLEQISDQILTSGQKYAAYKGIQMPIMYEYHGTQYLGAAHGLCGILHVLLQSPWLFGTNWEATKSTKHQLIENTVNAFLELQDSAGNFPVALEDSRSSKRLVHWCHGAPGAIHMLVLAYRVFKNPRYLESARRATELVWEKGLLRKGPGICHGVAGNGYCFLTMYRETGDSKYLHRATQFSKFLEDDEFLQNARVPDRPYSLFEGLAGTVCFLCDLLEPERADFPFMRVF